MSELGHKRTPASRATTSAFRSKAEVFPYELTRLRLAGGDARSVVIGALRNVGNQAFVARALFYRTHSPQHGTLRGNEPERESDMSDPKLAMEVPPQVRDFAVKSVDQAERAISSFLESANKSVAMVPSPTNDLSFHEPATTEKNLKAAFEHAR